MAPAFNYKHLVVSTVSILIAGTAYGFGCYLLPMVIPEMAGTLHLSYTSIGIITGVGQTSALLSIPLAGFLTPRIGGLKLIVGIQVIGSLALMGFYFVQGFYSFLILNFLIRAWPVMTWIPLVSIAVEQLPLNYRSPLLIGASSATGFFMFIDGVMSSFFLEHYDWRTMWVAAAFISLGIGVFSWIGLKWVGSWKVAAQPESRQRKHSHSELIAWLKTRSGIILNLLFILTGMSIVTFQVYLAPYLRDELNVGLDTIALMWSTMGIASIFGGLFFSLITDRLGVRVSSFLIFLFGSIAVFLLCSSVSAVYLILVAVLFGVSQACVYGMGPAYISKVLSAGSASNAFTIGTMLISVGSFFGNFTCGWSQGVLGTFWWSYVAIGALFAFAALLSLLLVSERPAKNPKNLGFTQK